MGFKGFKGQLSVTSPGTSVYVKWKEIEIMYHVCPYMNAEQQRRLVGNDTILIYYHESQDKPFNASAPRSSMTQIFAVVQPKGNDYYK